MFVLRPLASTLLVIACLMATPPSAHAAQSYDNCTGFIDSLPATVTTQGTWCLRHDLATSITSGNAITISTNNVTIDCNDFKLGGLGAGDGTMAIGIDAYNRLNATVRRCNIRGFFDGVVLHGGGGHVVEDNRFDSNTYTGLQIDGDGSVARRNQVTDTGGSSSFTGSASGILTNDSVDVLDNSVSGVLPSPVSSVGLGWAYGIFTSGNTSGSVSGNRVRGLVKQGTGGAMGIVNEASGRMSLRGNDVSGDGSNGVGISCQTAQGRAKDNIVNGFTTGIETCGDAGGNDIN